MAISLKHNKTSALPNGTDNSLIQPSDWNAEHTLTLASSRLLGRTTAGTGAAEEISVGSGLSFASGSLSLALTSVLVTTALGYTPADDAAIVTAAKGGTGQSTYAIGDILYASGSTALSKLAGVATGNALISGGVGTAPSWGKIGLTTHVSGTLAIANGGTGATTAATARTNLGLGTAATAASSDFAAASHTHAIADVTGLQTALDGKQAVDAELTAISALTVNGLIARTSASTAASRSIAAGTGISVTNGDGVSGNPTVTLANTAVTAGSYTLASITVDAQGRLTAASSGAAVASFNTRTGAVTLSSSDVTTALGYTPFSSAGGTLTGDLTSVARASVMAQNDTSASIEIRNNGSTGDSNMAMVRWHCQGTYGLKMGLRSDGFFGIGGWSAAAWRWYLNAGNGDMVAAGNVTAYSDERYKTNWRNLSDDFITGLAQVKTGVYDRTDVESTQVGVSAQSIQSILPQVVSEGVDGMLTVAYGNAALASAVMLARKVVELESRLAALEAV